MALPRQKQNHQVHLFDASRPAPGPLFTLKDMIHYFVLLVTMVVFYFTALKDQEVRIAILETKIDSITHTLEDIKIQSRSVLDALTQGR